MFSMTLNPTKICLNFERATFVEGRCFDSFDLQVFENKRFFIFKVVVLRVTTKVYLSPRSSDLLALTYLENKN